MEEKEKISADETLNQIVSDTMTRFNELNENEYLKMLGIDTESYPNITEERINNVALFNMYLAFQRRLLKIVTNLNVICANLDMKSKNEALKKSKKRGNKKNGK